MTQVKINSAFVKLRIASDEKCKNMSDKLDILKPKTLQSIDQIREKRSALILTLYMIS